MTTGEFIYASLASGEFASTAARANPFDFDKADRHRLWKPTVVVVCRTNVSRRDACA